ncbi:MAG: DUF4959 domain-containing protein [Dysgonamonadaceae bacterium]|jgi:hypothetical protein|nr:DUF4959 domain-containing protein [Dysgonamonadaceae bacterium]
MKKYLFLFISLLTIVSCSQWEQPLSTEQDNVAPGPVTINDVVPGYGELTVYFTPPTDLDLVGVRATFLKNGTEGELSETFASYHSGRIILKGFGDTIPHKFTLYAVDESNNLSEPKEGEEAPLPNVIALVSRTLTTMNGPGGIYVEWDNPTQQDIAILVSVYDSIKSLQKGDSVFTPGPFYFSSQARVEYTMKYDTAYFTPEKEKMYKFEFIDEWWNYSSPVYAIHAPMKESPLPTSIVGSDGKVITRSLYGMTPTPAADNTHRYHGDCGPGSTGFDASFYQEWSDDATYWWDNNAYQADAYFEANVIPKGIDVYPYYFTIDFGFSAIFTTFVLGIEPRDDKKDGTGYGTASVMSDFEIWGCKEEGDMPSNTAFGFPISLGSKADVSEHLRYWTSWSYLDTIAIHGDNLIQDADGNYNYAYLDTLNATQSGRIVADYKMAGKFWETDGTWELLISREKGHLVLPSGMEGLAILNGNLYIEDVQALRNGISFQFPFRFAQERKTYRYLRFKVLGTTSGTNRSRVDYLGFLGEKVD